MSAQQKIKRKPLAIGNEYCDARITTNRFRIESVNFNLGFHSGVEIRWVGHGTGTQFFFLQTESAFWGRPLFQNAIDAEVE